ncbi:MAG: antibiotic biosynthesis monooxygenase [Bacteroidales bacterium]|nr:antibiotic biosynthesis monooxygenase [Bacteroidales bacterium]
MSQKDRNTLNTGSMIVRIAEIEVYPEYLSKYLSYASEVDRLSLQREPGVISLFPMQDPENPCQIRILEIYANDAVYQAHLKTDHFQKYKQGTLHMVKSLNLKTMNPLDKEMMKAIFGKMR